MSELKFGPRKVEIQMNKYGTGKIGLVKVCSIQIFRCLKSSNLFSERFEVRKKNYNALLFQIGGIGGGGGETISLIISVVMMVFFNRSLLIIDN